jgi:hypothetical protein
MPFAQRSKLRLRSSSRSPFRSSNVELAKARKVRIAIGMAVGRKSDDTVFVGRPAGSSSSTVQHILALIEVRR